ncbi:hypothetical protein RM553_14100 [Zunongwangia sp. F363]|uniref:Uncharacterized protein n=1 Tax=Autumnicola tepida TaxID=3075595 RepID=A0ABU3CCB7_9FLAO|nr:hypothetical protein [Zunongwangia sp. F363]MDT0643966.1 hypothetical protein [Zunongwangia sp. F363]
MLKFLRKVNLKDGKFKRYLLYLLGEMLLIVLGILMALQIHNWKQLRENSQIEKQYLENIKRQLQEDLEEIRGNKEYNQKYLKEFSTAIKIIQLNDQANVDTLGKISADLSKYSDFRRKSNVYQSLINSGEVKYITNYEIIGNLQSLEETYTLINRLEETHNTAIMNFAVPTLVDVMNFSTLTVKKPEVLFDYRYQNMFVLFIELMNEKEDIYEKAQIEIENIVLQIDQEIVPR